MVGPKKFTVVKFTGVLQPGKNPYKCVPTSWTKIENANGAVVPYPAEDQLSLWFDRIYYCKLPAAEWNTWPVSIEYEAGESHSWLSNQKPSDHCNNNILLKLIKCFYCRFIRSGDAFYKTAKCYAAGWRRSDDMEASKPWVFGKFRSLSSDHFSL